MTGHRRLGAFLAVGAAVVLAVAVLVAPWASDEPDGLERVAIDHGFDDAAGRHALDESPTAGYGLGDDDGPVGTAVAGAVGVAVTFAVAAGVVALLRRRSGTGERDP